MIIQVYRLSKHHIELGMVGHTFNPSSQKTEAGRSLEFEARLVWSTEPVPGQPELHRETLSQKQTNKKPTQTNKQKTEKGQVTNYSEL